MGFNLLRIETMSFAFAVGLSAVSCDFILFHPASNMAVIRKFNL